MLPTKFNKSRWIVQLVLIHFVLLNLLVQPSGAKGRRFNYRQILMAQMAFPGDLMSPFLTSNGIDFQVNEENYPATFLQTHPDLAVFPDSSVVIVWQDNRNGVIDIYAHRCDRAGQPLGNNFKVNDDNLGAESWGDIFPKVAVAPNGTFIVVWHDHRGEDWDIYFQLFDKSGELLGNNQRLNDVRTGDQEFPAVAATHDCTFVVAWQDYRNENHDIYFQHLHSSGQLINTNVIVNDDLNDAEQEFPAVAVNRDGSFIIVWKDSRNQNMVWQGKQEDNCDIYFQQYSPSDAPVGPNIQANTDVTESLQHQPAIASAPDGAFVIVWTDCRDDDSDIYLQRFDQSGKPEQPNVLVNDDAMGASQETPVITITNDGAVIVAWQDDREGPSQLYRQIYDAKGIKQGNNTRLNTEFGAGTQAQPALSSAGSNLVMFAWEQYQQGQTDIYFQGFTSTMQPTAQPSRVNDDLYGATQTNPALMVTADGGFVVVWEDRRNGDQDIYLQRYNRSGEPEGTNVRVNTSETETNQYSPAIAPLAGGLLVVAWEDESNGDVYFQRFDRNGVKIGVNTKINDNPTGADVWYPARPAIAAFEDGSFVVVWKDNRNGNQDIYWQRFDPSGARQGNNVQMYNSAISENQFAPAVAVTTADTFVVVWIDRRGGGDDIYFQRYTHSGVAVDDNIQVNETNSLEQWSPANPSIATFRDGSFVVVWTAERNTEYDIYLQRFDSAGQPIVSNQRVEDESLTNIYQFDARVAATKNSEFVVVWKDWRNSWKNSDIYAQKYAADGTKIGSNFRVNNDQTLKPQRAPVVACTPFNEMIFVWEDTRQAGQGYDIYATTMPFDTTNTPPAAPTLLSPANGTTLHDNSVTLTWSVPTDSEGDSLHFIVELATNSSFTEIFSTYASPQQPTLFEPLTPVPPATGMASLNALLPDLIGEIWWRVAAFDNKIRGPYSETWSFSLEPAPSPTGISVLPNPFTPNNDGKNDFVEFKYPDMSTQPPVIRIFNLRGQKVNELTDFQSPVYRWYGVDDTGNKLESGVYIYILEVNGKQVASGTITVVR